MDVGENRSRNWVRSRDISPPSNWNVYPGDSSFADNTPMQSADESQLWGPGPSLWSLIAEHVSRSELPKIHTALGASLVDEYTEVHSEAATWHRMWRESRGGGGGSSSSGGTALPRQHASPLADPPAVKELLRGEVKMLLQAVGERSRREGRAAEELWARYKPEAVDYALGRPRSARRGAGGAEHGSRPGSARSHADHQVQALRERLNVSDIDQVAKRLRSVLTEECEALNRMVNHFKGNIKQKLPSPCEVDQPEASLAELRELRGAIQVDLQLYPPSLSASQAASPRPCVGELKSSFRLPAAHRVSEETLRALSSTSAFRPRPPPAPPADRPTSRRPRGAPAREAPASPEAVNGCSLSRVPAEQRSTSAGRRIKAPVCNGIAAPANRHFATSLPGPDAETVILPELHSPALCFRSPTSCLRGNSAGHESHPSSLRTVVHDSSRRGGLWLTEGERSPSCRSRNISLMFTRGPGGPCPHPAAVVIHGQLFAPPRGALESIASQASELQLVSQRVQPVPPARATT
ncbi:coiled-coil domain-containing protein 24 isoform 2-T2 [Spinachia spinachia]